MTATFLGAFSLEHRALLKFRVDAFDESGGVGVGPVGMLRFEVGADLFPVVSGRSTLALERERSRTDFGDQIQFRRPLQNRIELSAVGSCHHLVECRTLCLGATDPVGVLVNNLKPPLFREPPQIKRLSLRVLIAGGNSGIQNGSLHLHRLSWLKTSVIDRE